MPLFGRKNKNSATDRRSNDLSDDTYGRNDPLNSSDTNNSWDKTASGPADNRQFQDPSYQQTGYNSTLPTTGNQATIGTEGTGMTGHRHHPHVQQQGPVVGAAPLREQAMMHDREAQNVSAQSKELAEAEALEQQAREHRERAVAQGAHPHNKYLGGNPATADVGSAAPQPRSGF
ncbi:hypothetical protein BDY19DRAFT_427246 [Irpex rosettiformis]|uniref:Uncharacterized protein n=1 Tax=Irpex rosettiformis TaxID=378272 RepID=A0ACB8UGQ0_9APHY|nr:hypothetical protein BDY19DRAFT_427246 [Irpex rosettiformis]